MAREVTGREKTVKAARTIVVTIAALLVAAYLWDNAVYRKKARVRSSIVMYQEEMRAYGQVEERLSEFSDLINELDAEIKELNKEMKGADSEIKASKEYEEAEIRYAELAGAREKVNEEYGRIEGEYEKQRRSLMEKLDKAVSNYNSLPHPIIFRRTSLKRNMEASSE